MLLFCCLQFLNILALKRTEREQKACFAHVTLALGFDCFQPTAGGLEDEETYRDGGGRGGGEIAEF